MSRKVHDNKRFSASQTTKRFSEKLYGFENSNNTYPETLRSIHSTNRFIFAFISQDWKSIFFGLGALSFVYGLLLLLCKWKEVQRENAVRPSSTGTLPTSGPALPRKGSSSFRRQSSVNSASPSSTSGGEAVSLREAEKMNLSLWKQTTLSLRQSISLYLNWTLGLIAFCGGVIYFGVFQLWMTPYLVAVHGYSRTTATSVVGAGLISYVFVVCD